MAKTRFIVVLLAVIATVGVGVAVGSIAGGSKQPIAVWTPPAGTAEAQTATPGTAIIVPTLIPTAGNLSTPQRVPATAVPTESTPVPNATPASTATPLPSASPEASPRVATPIATTFAPLTPTTTIGSFNQLTPTGP